MDEQNMVPEQDNSVGMTGGAPVAVGGSKIKIVLAVVLVAALGVGGFFAYRVYAAPQKIWKQFMSNSVVPQVVTEKFSVSYTDNGVFDESLKKSNPYASYFSHVKGSFQGTAYVNAKNIENPELTMDVNYLLGAGDTSFGSRFQVKMADKIMYLNLGDNPVITGVLSMVSPDKKVEWLKFDFKKLQSLAQSEMATATPAQVPDTAKIMAEAQKISLKHWNKLVVVQKVLGREKINGVSTIHYQNTVNKDEMKQMLKEVFDLATQNSVSASPEISKEDLNQAKEIISLVSEKMIDRIEIKSFETWVGVSDAQLYKAKIETSAPSLASLFTLGEGSLSSNQTPQEIIESIFSKVSFDGVVAVDFEFSDYGKVMAIQAPSENVLDVVSKLESMKSAQQVPDSGVHVIEPGQAKEILSQ